MDYFYLYLTSIFAGFGLLQVQSGKTAPALIWWYHSLAHEIAVRISLLGGRPMN